MVWPIPPMTIEETPRPPVLRAGVIALVGRPNVGKSTLLNALVGESLSIVTPKPETTRDRVLAVVTRPLNTDAQLVVVDTPGIHRAHRRLGEYMNTEARTAANDADVVVMVTDATDGEKIVSLDAEVLAALANCRTPVILCFNKVDRVRPRNAMLPTLDAISKAREFAEVVPMSATTGDGVERLIHAIIERLPASPALYPEDTLTDRSERFFVAERIREAVISETGEELPFVTAIEIERFDEKASIPRITASIHVERDGQKKIMIGRGGERIKAIGSRARVAVEALLGKQVFLELWVKVTPDWTSSPDALTRFGYKSEPKGRKRQS
jgi:GTPase